MKMRKLVWVACIALSASMVARADDGGVMGIRVKQSSMTKDSVDPNSGKLISEPVTQPSYTVNLNGGDARKLMRILPPSLTVLTNMYPKFAKTYNANFRYLEITAGNNEPVVVIGCDGGEL